LPIRHSPSSDTPRPSLAAHSRSRSTPVRPTDRRQGDGPGVEGVGREPVAVAHRHRGRRRGRRIWLVREHPEVVGADLDPLGGQEIADPFHRADPGLLLAIANFAEIALVQARPRGRIGPRRVGQPLQRPAQIDQMAVERRPVESLPVGHRRLASLRLTVGGWHSSGLRRAARDAHRVGAVSAAPARCRMR